ncbi:NOC4L protein, partial [Columbina picui]|nr:NOC4L protein [Columbina picui]
GGAISLLALNGLFVLIHQHNLEYPDFYKKLYSLLDPSVYHVKYRARFFHLLDLFLSSSHLPAYLVAAFLKRLSRLALTAPPEALLMVLPFICNLFRRHPACRVLVHRPDGPQGERGAGQGGLCCAVRPHHERDSRGRGGGEIPAPVLFDKEVKKKAADVPLEFEQIRGLFGKKNDIFAQHFALD